MLDFPCSCFSLDVPGGELVPECVICNFEYASEGSGPTSLPSNEAP